MKIIKWFLAMLLFVLLFSITYAQNQDPTKITGTIIGVPKPTANSAYLVGLLRDAKYYEVTKSAFQDSVLGLIPGVLVTTGTYTVLAANSGQIHFIPNLAGNTSINLPAEVAGLHYEFWYTAAAVETHDHTISPEADVNFFIGGVSFLDTDAGSGADEVHLGIYSDGNSNSDLVLNNLAAGSVVNLVCDGTNWYLTGQILSDTVPSLSDQ